MSILLSADTGSVRLDVGEGSLCVRHSSYEPPRTGDECRHLEFSEFADDPRKHMNGCGVLVLVGLNKIIGPSNRTKEVFEVLFNLSDSWHKISVDRTLFVSEPWRAWFHFGLVGAKYREYTYSYLAESNWQSYRDGKTCENPFSINEIVRWGRGVIRSDYERYFDTFDIDRIEMSEETKDAYQRLKTLCFDEERTLPAILARLSAFAQQSCPTRKIPSQNRLFANRYHRIVQTDLGVDDFLVERLLGLVKLTNSIGREFSGAC